MDGEEAAGHVATNTYDRDFFEQDVASSSHNSHGEASSAGEPPSRSTQEVDALRFVQGEAEAPSNGEVATGDQYTMRIEGWSGPANPALSESRWDPCTVSVLNCWPLRHITDAQRFLEAAGYPLDGTQPFGLCRIVMPLNPQTQRARGMLFVTARNAANADYMIRHLSQTRLTAPKLSRRKRPGPEERVSYVLILRQADTLSPRDKRPGVYRATEEWRVRTSDRLNDARSAGQSRSG